MKDQKIGEGWKDLGSEGKREGKLLMVGNAMADA